MYPFAHAWPSYQSLYRAVATQLPWLPAELETTGDVHGTWEQPDVIVGQACGYPAAALVRDKIQVFGAFELSLEHAVGHRYRSILLARRPGQPHEFSQAKAAANSVESLSGYLSLTVAIHGLGARVHEPVVFTGAHRASVRALSDGDVDIAAIDGLSLRHLLTEDPTLLDALHAVGVGPLIPTPALYTTVDLPPDRVAALQAAFARAVEDPALAPVLARLHISGFRSLTMADYDETLDLVRSS